MFSTYAIRFGINRELALKISGGFGGGMAGLGNTCGAITGAFMILGLKYGNEKIGGEEPNKKLFTMIREFVSRFELTYNTIKCRDLIGYDISTPEGRQLAKDKNIFNTICPKVILNSAAILEEMLSK
ncbi:MAG: C-GCAxxG-C-C family protein [Promethearchaeota archaeon]